MSQTIGAALQQAMQVGDLNKAFELAVAAASEQRLPLTLLWTRLGAAFRQDDRFLPLMEQIGLTDYWRRFGAPDLCAATADPGYTCN